MASDKLLLTLPEVAHRLSIGRSKLYELLEAGELPVIRIGTAVRIPAGAVQDWVERRVGKDTNGGERQGRQ